MFRSRVEPGTTYVSLTSQTNMTFIGIDYHTLQTATGHTLLAGDVCEVSILGESSRNAAGLTPALQSVTRSTPYANS